MRIPAEVAHCATWNGNEKRLSELLYGLCGLLFEWMRPVMVILLTFVSAIQANLVHTHLRMGKPMT